MVMRSNAKNMHRLSTVPASAAATIARRPPGNASSRTSRVAPVRTCQPTYAPSARKPMIARHATNAGGSMPAS